MAVFQKVLLRKDAKKESGDVVGVQIQHPCLASISVNERLSKIRKAARFAALREPFAIPNSPIERSRQMIFSRRDAETQRRSRANGVKR
jgi:hypothetical protein